MTGNPVCFNPDLLAGMDDQAVEYQELVYRLTDGIIPDPLDPCVDAGEVPASFVINDIDPEDPLDMRVYFYLQRHYQTSAGLFKWTGGVDFTTPEGQEWMTLGSCNWEKRRENPLSFIECVAGDSQHASARAYISLLDDITFTPDDRVLKAVKDALHQKIYVQHEYVPAAEFVLLEIYRQAKSDDLRFSAAVDLLKRYENRNSPYLRDPPVVDDESLRLWQEWTAELVPIFISLHEQTSDPKFASRLANALSDIGGSKALDYLVGRVFGDAARDRGAFDALLSNIDRPEVAEALARIAEFQPANVGYIAHAEQKRKILEKVAQGAAAYDSRLARAVVKVIAETHQTLLGGRSAELVFGYAARQGNTAVKPLLSIVTCPDSNPFGTIPSSLRIAAFWALANTDNPTAHQEVKKIIRDEYYLPQMPQMPQMGAPRLLRDDLVIELVDNVRGSRATQTAIELVDELEGVQVHWLINRMGLYSANGRDAEERAYRYFQKLSTIAGDTSFYPASPTAVEAMQRLAVRYVDSFVARIGDFTPKQQVFLINRWVSYHYGSSLAQLYTKLRAASRLSAEAREKLDDEIAKQHRGARARGAAKVINR